MIAWYFIGIYDLTAGLRRNYRPLALKLFVFEDWCLVEKGSRLAYFFFELVIGRLGYPAVRVLDLMESLEMGFTGSRVKKKSRSYLESWIFFYSILHFMQRDDLHIGSWD
jgi:hypothetical protein